MPNFKIETDEDEYRLVADGEEGSVVPYGHTSVLTLGDEIYYTTMVDSDSEKATVYKIDEVTEVSDAETEDVEFKDDGAGIALVATDDEP